MGTEVFFHYTRRSLGDSRRHDEPDKPKANGRLERPRESEECKPKVVHAGKKTLWRNSAPRLTTGSHPYQAKLVTGSHPYRANALFVWPGEMTRKSGRV
jgi:hypothetical protein